MISTLPEAMTAIAHPDLFGAGRTTGTVGILSLGSNKTLYSAYGGGGFRRRQGRESAGP